MANYSANIVKMNNHLSSSLTCMLYTGKHILQFPMQSFINYNVFDNV